MWLKQMIILQLEVIYVLSNVYLPYFFIFFNQCIEMPCWVCVHIYRWCCSWNEQIIPFQLMMECSEVQLMFPSDQIKDWWLIFPLEFSSQYSFQYPGVITSLLFSCMIFFFIDFTWHLYVKNGPFFVSKLN